MTRILVVNSGSSSLKYQLFDMENESVLAVGLIERIGSGTGHVHHRAEPDAEGNENAFDRDRPIADHHAAFEVMLEAFAEHGPDLTAEHLTAIGHRVVQGGSRYSCAALVDNTVRDDIRELSELAPLHNPANLAGIDAAAAAFPGVAQVAVFDTAFHQTLAPAAYTYAIDRDVAAEHEIRRYGFHGTSHKYVSERAADLLGRPVESLRIIVLHLGNGASACAVDGGRSVDTSMGMTPLEGLVMGTRTGDIDPAVLLHLAHRGWDAAALDDLVNKRSGLLGLAGSGDLRDVYRQAQDGDASSALALEVYTRRITHYIGAYVALLGGADALVFTAGVGENSAVVRARSTAGLAPLGIVVDEERNGEKRSDARVISPDGAAVAVLVVPTDEELEIARQSAAAVAAAASSRSA